MKFAPTISSQDRGESEGKDKVIMTALTMIPTIGINEGTRSLGFSKFRKERNIGETDHHPEPKSGFSNPV